MAFCSNCGLKLEEGVNFCPNCGKKITSASENNNLNEKADFTQTQSSLVRIQTEQMETEKQKDALTTDEKSEISQTVKSNKKWLTALLLCIFLGGGHRFYVGKVGTGIIMFIFWIIGYLYGSASLQTSVYFGPAILVIPGIFFCIYTIWWIVDLFSICKEKFKDKKGFIIKKD